MYGAFGRITDIEPLDLNRKRSWPMIRVSADWPGGMSGGPVFNSAGDVIGVISAGVDATSSTAMVFGGWGAAARTFPAVDRARPGRFLCFGVLDSGEKLIGIGGSRDEARAISAENAGSFVSAISVDPNTGAFVRREL